MQRPAHVRVWHRLRDGLRATVRRCSATLGEGERSEPAPGWRLEVTRRSETRWVRRDETVECFRFDDGYVSTVSYGRRDVTWQLTPGPVSLGSALAVAALYLQHGVTPQFDRSGGMFIAVADGAPTQVFEEFADRPVEYVFLDGFRTVEEFPPFIEVSPNLERVFDRMSPTEQRPLGG